MGLVVESVPDGLVCKRFTFESQAVHVPFCIASTAAGKGNMRSGGSRDRLSPLPAMDGMVAAFFQGENKWASNPPHIC
jgi:hypothetical protein